jgi:hypothetical protein
MTNPPFLFAVISKMYSVPEGIKLEGNNTLSPMKKMFKCIKDKSVLKKCKAATGQTDQFDSPRKGDAEHYHFRLCSG